MSSFWDVFHLHESGSRKERNAFQERKKGPEVWNSSVPDLSNTEDATGNETEGLHPNEMKKQTNPKSNRITEFTWNFNYAFKGFALF